MTNPKKDIEAFLREIDIARDDVAKAHNGEAMHANPEKPKSKNFNATVKSASVIIVLLLALFSANRATKQQVNVIAAGSVGASAGLLIGYVAGRRRD